MHFIFIVPILFFLTLYHFIQINNLLLSLIGRMDIIQEQQYITNIFQLKDALNKCPKCKKLTMNGDLIMSHEHLVNLDITKIKKKKLALIINSENDASIIGHWFVILIWKKYAIFADGQQKLFSNREDVMLHIRRFCSKNSLKFINQKLKIQKNRSFKCGFIALFLVAKFSILSFKSFLALRAILNNNSISSNEKFILNFVKRHFRINI